MTPLHIGDIIHLPTLDKTKLSFVVAGVVRTHPGTYELTLTNGIEYTLMRPLKITPSIDKNGQVEHWNFPENIERLRDINFKPGYYP